MIIDHRFPDISVENGVYSPHSYLHWLHFLDGVSLAMPLFVLFILVPLLEIYLLLKVGGLIGAFPTILVIVVTAILGTWLLKQQGASTLRRYQTSLSQGKLPAQEMIEGFALLFGGALLLTPGFFTDIIGLLCLLPVTRRPLVRWLMKKAGRLIMVKTVGATGFSSVIDKNDSEDSIEGGRVYDDRKHSRPTDRN